MDWILIAYLIALIFLSTRLLNAEQVYSLRRAWMAFALIPFLQFTMCVLRLGELTSSRGFLLIQTWEQALTSFLLGLSLWRLVGAIAPDSQGPGEK